MMNRFHALRLLAALLCGVTLTGCSLLKVSVSTGDPLPKEDIRTRTMTRGFYYDLSDEVARTADSIAAAAPDTKTKMAAIRWKLAATRAAMSAALQTMPEVALADTWILTRRMDAVFAARPDSLLFGAQSTLARDVAKRLANRAQELARTTLDADRYALMREFVEQYLQDNPPAEGITPVDTSLAWIEYLQEKGIENSYVTGTIAEVLADVSDKVTGQGRQLSNSIGWSKELLELQFEQDSLRTRVERQLDSLERNFNRMVAVAEHLPEISDHMLDELREQGTQVISTLNYSVENAFQNLDRQRDALQHYISAERKAVIDQLRQAADDTLQAALSAVPGMIGKVVFYVVLGLIVLLGLPFLAGFWLGGLRQRVKERRKVKGEK